MPVMRADVIRIKDEWNSHRIREQKANYLPSGIPDIMYNTPELYNTTSFGTYVSIEDVEACKRLYSEKADDPCKPIFMDLFSLMHQR